MEKLPRKPTSFIRPLVAGLAVSVLIALARAEVRADPLVLTLSDPVRNIAYNGTATFSPERATLLLLGSGVAGLAGLARRRRRNA
ncbi:MAG TPA: hypothetical protein VF297_31190 [Pyrinomonadaceae bacterium]